MAVFRQFLLLTWKNWLIQKRRVFLTVVEVLLPCLLAAVLIAIRTRIEVERFDNGQDWDSFSVDKFDSNLIPMGISANMWMILNFTLPWNIAYSPKNAATQRILTDTLTKLGINPMYSINQLGFNNENELIDYFMKSNISDPNLAGIVFKDGSAWSPLPETIDYKLRFRSTQRNSGLGGLRNMFAGLSTTTDWFTEFMFPRFQRPEPRERNRPKGGVPGYEREGFLALQLALDQAIIKEFNNSANVQDVKVQLRRFPYPKYIRDPFILVLQRNLPFILLLSFIVVAATISKDIVLEKERKLKETMKMMGLRNWLHWTAWFFKYFLFLLITVILLTILFYIPVNDGSTVNHSDPFIVFFFLLLYCIATIAFCFMVSTFFSKANSGAAGGGILFLATYVPYFFMQNDYENLTFAAKFAPSLLHNVAMSMGCTQLALFEGSGEGLQWNNLGRPISVDDDFSMGIVYGLLVLDTVLYLLITWYIDAVYPGAYGIGKPWYFPVTKWYWCGKDSKVMSQEEEDPENLSGFNQDKDYIEPTPSGQKVGIQVRNLRKVFKVNGREKVAVAGMSMDMFEGQITAVLGHNGAGKTTTMSILTGFLPPTSGTAYVNGYNIQTDIESVRSSLGLCPQHDVLFDVLTVREHLVFFAKLKGLRGAEVDEEVDKMISLLKLDAKRDVQSSKLSGGMKRKLSVGIALIGNTEIVILDEPTSGMDPEARRQIWDILQSQRRGRTMILTTHFMDEADYLGDRIAIMAEGVVKCCGSSLFLKKKYGVGYHMGIVKQQSCDVDQVTGTICKFVPDAKLESNISAELSYVLPQESSNRFEEMFDVLENNKAQLGISSYGASVTTMEEVFFKVGESIDEGLEERLTHKAAAATGRDNQAFDAPEVSSLVKNDSRAILIPVEEKTPLGNDRPQTPPPDYDERLEVPRLTRMTSVFGTDSARNTGFALYRQQFWAMFVKRVLHSWRNRLVTLTQLLVPLFFTILSCIVLRTFPSFTENAPARPLNMAQFTEEQIVAYVTKSKSPTALDGKLAAAYDSFMKTRAGRVTLKNLDQENNFKTDTNLQNYVKSVGADSISTYNNRFMLGAVFNTNGSDTVAEAGFNNQAYHTPAIALNMLTNSLLKHFAPAGDDRYIKVTNEPLPKTEAEKIDDGIGSSSALGFVISYNMMFGLAFLIATFSVFLIKERVVKSKHIQFVSGVHSFNFWISTFTWDIINYLIPCLLLLIVFAAFDIEPYYKGNNLGYVLLIFVLYGWSIIPLVYLLSFLFSVAASGYVWLSVLNIFFGTAGVMAVVILKIPDLGTKDVADALEWVFFFLFPNYSFGQALSDIYTNYETLKLCTNKEVFDISTICPYLPENVTAACCKDKCGDNCATYNENYFALETPGIGRPVLFMSIQGLFYFAILFLIESQILVGIWQRAIAGSGSNQNSDEALRSRTGSMQMSPHRHLREDDDVANERSRIAQTPKYELEKSENLVLSELKKFYGSFLAVDRLSIGIPRGECFGLLGINGAGKTSTFKMLTGDETITSGEAMLDGYNVKTEIKKVQQRLGYCPQFDALIEQMTVRETLTMYGRLRGLPENEIASVVQDLIKSLLLGDHTNKLASDLSGGNKRKLSAAIALIGDPPIVFLDEPTTGMDPVARRLLWDTLSKVRASGRTLVLTSHSMEECEALCTRLAIMVNGQFKCLGSPQHLKAKFGQGYSLMAKVHIPENCEDPDEQIQPLIDFIENTFPGCVLKDEHHGLVLYQIKSEGTSWASIFGTMERAKDRFNIEDYSVSQTTLEQVFLNFARAQNAPSDETMKCTTQCGNCCQFFFCCGCCENQGNREIFRKTRSSRTSV